LLRNVASTMTEITNKRSAFCPAPAIGYPSSRISREEALRGAEDEAKENYVEGREVFRFVADYIERKMDPADPLAEWGEAMVRKIRMSLERMG